MNKNIRENEQTVSSKYFTTNSVMDESLSEFQEPKKLSGPKASTKKAKPVKAKKAPKRIRGQKDIRSALKTKKNELEKYAEDFDKVCKHARLDVDSEELQLAIALSRSLQESSNTDGVETSQSRNTQERVGKIRTTLLEYGFKVPEIKKPIIANKRLKKKSNYKLLTTSEEAKKQIVSDKYSQILFENITVSKKDKTDIKYASARLFNLATSTNYCILKDINTFYVENLMEKSTATGNLLRDWSEIPGRPVSPAIQASISMNFSEIDCSQDELDIVLSGSLKCCKNIIKGKEAIRLCKTDIYSGNGADKDSLDNSVIIIDEEIPKPCATLALNARECISIEIPVVEVDQYRSCSPDLFEDETSLMEHAKSYTQENKLQTQENLRTPVHTNDVMDLTECDTELKSNYSKDTVKSQTSQKNNVTNRCNDLMEITECIENHDLNTYTTNRNVTKHISNDFMEITKCVAGPFTPNTIDGIIDLTQSTTILNKKDVAEGNETIQDDDPIEIKSGNNQTIDETDKKKEETLSSDSNNIDLTESPKVFETAATNQDALIDNDNPFEIKCDTIQTRDKTDDEKKEEIISIEPINIDLTDCSKTFIGVTNNNKSVENLDLTQSSNTSDELPYVYLGGTKNNSQASVETIMDPKDYEYQNQSIAQDDFLDLTQNHHEYPDNSAYFDLVKDNQYKSIDVHTSDTHYKETVLDLTQETAVNSPRKNSRHSQTNVSFFEEYVHDHSDNNVALDTSNDHKNNKEVPISHPNSFNVQLNTKDDLSDDIDLTQNTDSSESENNDVLVNQSIESQGYGDATIEMEICKGAQSDIDLTQNSESEELSQYSQRKEYNYIENELDSDATVEEDADKDLKIIENDIVIKSSQRCSTLGKKDNISIDYDEINDDLADSSSQQSKSLTKSATDSNIPNKSQETSNCSQNSEVFVISDNELDYSMHKSKLEKPVENFILGGISIMNEFSGLSSFRRSTNIENYSAVANINEVNNIIEVEDYIQSRNITTPIKHRRVNELATPEKPSCSGINTVVTPSNNEYIIKTNDVTPIPKYESMSLEELHTELDKYGVKPFKRKRAIQLLTHIYNETHPILESNSDEETPCKRRKIDNQESPRIKTSRKLTPRKILSPKKTVKSPRKTSANKKSPRKAPEHGREKATTIDFRSERLINLEENNYEINETPFIKEVHCSPDDWVFQKREKAKVHSCRVPLHIAFFNYVSSRRWLKEAILCYEPVNIDDIHKDLVSYGHRYDPKDLLKFMDKKCITVKTTDNDGRNNKRY